MNAIDAVSEAVDELVAERIDRLTDGALEEELVGIRRQQDRLELEFCRRLRRFDAARGYISSGAPTTVSWLRTACRMSAAGAHERVEVASEIEALPEVADAWRQGSIGYHHVTALARSVREVGRTAFRSMLGELLDAARRLDPSRLRYVTRFLRYCVDPDGAAGAENEAHERRFLNLSQTFDGVFVLDGQLDAEAGAMLRAAINALNKPLPDETRTAAQRRADALTELAVRQLRSGRLPSTHGRRPHLVVTAHAGEPGEIPGAGPVSKELVQRLACDASITAVTVDPSGSPIGVDDTSRVIPPSVRTALAVRDRGCRFPRCDRPLEWTDAHHIRPRAEGGPRLLDNLVLLCRVHHRLVHEGGWRLSPGPSGSLQALPP